MTGLVAVFAVALALMVLRSKVKKRRRPATAADVMEAATAQGNYPHHVVRPVARDPHDGTRDVGF